MKNTTRHAMLSSLILGAVFASENASAFGRKFVLECILDGDAKFVLNIKKHVLIIAILVTGLILRGCNEEMQTKNKLFKETPIGTEFDKVVSYCLRKHLDCKQSLTTGYLNQETGEVVGVKSIWAKVDERKSAPLLITTIAVHWGFDDKGRLVDIWVWKVIEGP